MKRFIFLLPVICLVASCSEPPYVDRYYVYDDDDGCAFIFHNDGSVDIYEFIFREHIRGTYICDFPQVSVTITELDSEMHPEIRYYNEAPFVYQDSLWFSSQSDTLYKKYNDNSPYRSTLPLTTTNWLGFMLFRIGL